VGFSLLWSVGSYQYLLAKQLFVPRYFYIRKRGNCEQAIFMKVLFFLLISCMLFSCSSQKKLTENVLNSWIGDSKQNLILKWGPPVQTTSDGNNGEILVYANRIYYVLATGPVDYWEYRMMYVNAAGKIYHWLFKRNPNPPNRIDMRVLL